MKRMNLIGPLITLTLVLGIMGCQMFDDSPTEVAAPGTGPNADFIMGTPEVDGWGTYYETGGSFVRVDIPVSGAIKIDYSTTSGWSGAIFGSAGSPLGVEIGIKEDDIIDSVCISYVEGGSFSSMPSNIKENVKGEWIHYKRIHDDGSLSDWWPVSSAFEFSAEQIRDCAVIEGAVQWEVIPGGAFAKPEPTTPTISPEKILSCTELGYTRQDACATLVADDGNFPLYFADKEGWNFAGNTSVPEAEGLYGIGAQTTEPDGLTFCFQEEAGKEGFVKYLPSDGQFYAWTHDKQFCAWGIPQEILD